MSDCVRIYMYDMFRVHIYIRTLIRHMCTCIYIYTYTYQTYVYVYIYTICLSYTSDIRNICISDVYDKLIIYMIYIYDMFIIYMIYMICYVYQTIHISDDICLVYARIYIYACDTMTGSCHTYKRDTSHV